MRSVLGGVLPLAGPALYAKLGPNWAATLLGLLEIMIIPIPFVFYKYGHKIRMKSVLIRTMQTDKAKLDGKRTRRNDNDWENKEKGVEKEVGGGVLEKVDV